MNKQQRKTLAAVVDDLRDFAEVDQLKNFVVDLQVEGTLRQQLAHKLEDLKSMVESEHDEEQEKFDNMPESLQGGDRGQAMEEAIEQLYSAMSALDTAIADLQDEEAEGPNQDNPEAVKAHEDGIEQMLQSVADSVTEAIDAIEGCI